MTENEAIERIIRSACSSGKCYDACLYGEGNCEYDAAIIALKEVQRYREIGTVEECKMSDKRCSVGGVDRTKDIDRISLPNAVETPFWMAVWAAEPERMVDVRMSYSDLKIICDLIDKERSRRVV